MHLGPIDLIAVPNAASSSEIYGKLGVWYNPLIV